MRLKRYIVFLIISNIHLSLIAQPVLEKDFYPPVNSIVNFQLQDTNGITEGPSGANVTWDFSGLINEGTSSALLFTSSEGTFFENNFPTSNYYVFDSLEYNYDYVQTLDDSILLHGTINPSAETKWKYDDSKKLIEFPFSYLETIQDTFIATQTHADFGHSGEPAFRNGNIDVIYDGYGDLILPSITYVSIIRVKTVETYKDSICIFCSIGIDRIDEVIRTNFSWYVDSLKQIILEFETLDITINGSIKNYKKEIRLYDAGYVEYIPPSNNVSEVSIFPNPFNQSLSITNQKRIRSLSMYNLLGSTFLKRDVSGITDSKIDLSLSYLPDGLYFLKINFIDGGSLIKKIIKQ